MSEARRVLFLSEKFPWPVDDGGQARTFHVLRSLARSRPVTLIGHGPADPAHVAPIEALGVEVVDAGQRAPRLMAPAHAALATFTRAPHPLGKNRSRAMLRTLLERLARGDVRAVHFNHLDTAQYVERLGPLRAGVRCVFDTHNVLTTMYQRFQQTARNPLSRVYLGLQWSKMNRFEREIMKQLDLVCVCSELEREQLRTWGVEKVLVVPNGVDTEYFAPPPEPRLDQPLRIVFTGALGYPPNADGVRWFLDEVWPAIERALPGVRFTVVGKEAPAELTARAVPGRVEFTGYVDDVRPHMHGAAVFVCPLRIGGGTRLKILDALALGLPVVSTRIGAEGLAVTPRVDIELADPPGEFARAVIELCQDPARRERRARSGRELVVTRYGWEGVTRPLVERLESWSASPPA